MQIQSGRATTNRGEMAFLHGGSGQTVLFLHGVPGSARAWMPVLDRLDGDRHVVVPDLLGFGGSGSAGDLHAEAQAAAVLALLDVVGIDRVVAVTHDFGGPVALRMLEQRPDLVDGLLLSATNTFGDTPIPFPLSTIFWPLVGSLAASAVFSPPSLRMMLRTGAGRPRPALEPDVYIGDARQAQAIRTIFEPSLRSLSELYGPLSDLLARIAVPTSVVWGDRDPFFTVAHGRRTADAISGATFTALEDAGHFLPAERPADLVSAVDQLLARVTKDRA